MMLRGFYEQFSADTGCSNTEGSKVNRKTDKELSGELRKISTRKNIMSCKRVWRPYLTWRKEDYLSASSTFSIICLGEML
ncbi:Uncharacterised protein [Porphyromonas macacae]|uniref:Uncharacterized protein n=1 Tax=Porphyromonas macacae TaxID=28115 RepID=A0A379DHY8_9PORP|nr:Uncharacterised protein [Porphyromonas macacae]